ncbi:MAG: MerR family transcriptional regulator [Tannerella sp.]|nr:MerR family transcriptional regulator [Tannerella sp.]
MPEKLYYSIKQVAQKFGVNESTLRFWEKEFKEISPRKTENGVRYYTEDDIAQVRLIHHLIRERKLTIDGARRLLKDNREATVNNADVVHRLTELRGQVTALLDTLNEMNPK